MASIACALLTLAVTLPAGLPLGIAGLDIGSKLLSPPRVLSEVAEGSKLLSPSRVLSEVAEGSKLLSPPRVLSEVAEGILHLEKRPNVSRNKEEHDDVADLGWNLQLWP